MLIKLHPTIRDHNLEEKIKLSLEKRKRRE